MVVGTAIDPDMVDEMHVTVVVTGLDKSKDDEDKLEQKQVGETAASSMRSRSSDTPEWRRFEDRPMSRFKTDAMKPKSIPQSREEDSQYLDIPAFLRKQEVEEEI